MMPNRAEGWWGMACWNALSADQRTRLIEVGNLPFDYVPEWKDCERFAVVAIETQGDEAEGPRFYCLECAAAELLSRVISPEDSEANVRAMLTVFQRLVAHAEDMLRMVVPKSRYYHTDPLDPEAPIVLEEWEGTFGTLRPGMTVEYQGDLPFDGPLVIAELVHYDDMSTMAILNDGAYEVDANNLAPAEG